MSIYTKPTGPLTARDWVSLLWCSWLCICAFQQVIQEMFASTANFGLTVLVILDSHLQKFFEMVSEIDDMTKASSHQWDFLWQQAASS